MVSRALLRGVGGGGGGGNGPDAVKFAEAFAASRPLSKPAVTVVGRNGKE